ncbi:MAG TPA: FecR domain-containing protein [Polyangiaceae bacterium]|nr:FecR domain-containing protein [Polyangiaceae bacterium]
MSENERLGLPKLKLGWDEGRTERLLASVHVRIDRRKRAWRAAAMSATLVSVVCVALVAARWTGAPTIAPASNDAARQVRAENAIRLRDGSRIDVSPGTSEVRVVEESTSRVRVDLVRGTSRYSVAPNPDRAFEVRSGSVTITVIGTEFVVEQRGEATWVEVLRGKVRVSWADDRAFLETGESGTFPPSSAPSAAERGVAGREEIDAPTARGPHAATQVYRSRVARHDYRGAYAVLSRNPALAGDTVEELLVAADVARLSDHPSEAVPYLQRIIREHPRDERAPLAAFTLGRTLGGLGRTEEAMNMFGRVRSSWPKSPLGEDALLRQAEAAAQLGDIGAARRIAEQYDRDFPNGRRRSEVRRYARLD